MSVEQADITTFLQTWAGKSNRQSSGELASLSLETKGIPDPYYYEDEDGDLTDPLTGFKVRDIIVRDSYVGEVEGQAFDTIERWWARGESSGTIAWVSPPYPGIYETSKVIVSEIESDGENRRLFNRAIVLDIDEKECLRFGQALSQYSINKPFLTHSNQLRVTPIILSEEEPWINIFERLLTKESAWNTIRKGGDLEAKKQAVLEAERIFAEQDNRRAGILAMLGERISSCPTVFKRKTEFKLFSENSLVFGTEDYHIGSCDKCNRANVRVGACSICTSCEKTTS